MQDAVVATARAQERVVPRDGADASVMAAHGSHELVFGRVPNLQFASVSADCEVGTVATPLHAGDAVVGADVAELGDLAVHGGPEVDAGAEADCEHVLSRPVNQIEVEVVLEARGIEDLEGLLRDDSLLLVLF